MSEINLAIMESKMLDIQMRDIALIIIGAALSTGTHGIISKSLEYRRRIRMSVESFYFGPDQTLNSFVGHNYPDDDLIALDVNVHFFSNKTLSTGLRAFAFEFCRDSYIGPVVESVIQKPIYLNWLSNAVSDLSTVELPCRQFVKLDLHLTIDRTSWPSIRNCTSIYLACKTPDGNRMRFFISRFRFPDMPEKGLRGQSVMKVNIFPKGGGFFIKAVKHSKKINLGGEMTDDPEMTRYWTGSGWTADGKVAKIYKDHTIARDEGVSVKIWDLVPDEWIPKDGELLDDKVRLRLC